MGYYRGANRSERLKAAGAVVAVHVALGAAIVTGLNVDTVTTVVERLRTFDITAPEPPPPPPPPPQQARARDDEGAAGKKAEPTPVVAPEPKIEIPTKPPIPAAPVPGTGSASSAGAAASGSGTGAGGSGSGRGGGGNGDFSGYTPARLLSRIPHREYRRISSGIIPQGSAVITFRVNPNGSVSNCRILRSSGNSGVDQTVCSAAERHMRFSPARDAAGQPVAQDITYTPTWRPN